MRKFESEVSLNHLELKPHNIVFTYTTPQDYEMDRYILIENIDGLSPCNNEYLLLQGSHCSCYDFDETQWDAIVYTKEELEKLAKADYNSKDPFWNMVLYYL